MTLIPDTELPRIPYDGILLHKNNLWVKVNNLIHPIQGILEFFTNVLGNFFTLNKLQAKSLNFYFMFTFYFPCKRVN